MKKQIAISMSLIMLMNAAPVFAMDTAVTSAPAPQGGLHKGLESSAPTVPVAESTLTGSEATDTELAAIVGLSREQMYQKVSKMVRSFKAQQALIEAETNPLIKKLMRAQLLLAGIGTLGIGNDKSKDFFGGKKGLILGNLTTILNGVISAVRMTQDSTSFTSPEAKAKREAVKLEARKAMDEVRALFNDPSANIPTPIVKLEGRLRDITDALQKLDDNSTGTAAAEWVRIGSGALALAFLAGHFISPKLTEEAEKLMETAAAAKGRLAKFKDGLAKKATKATNASNVVGNLGVEGFVRAFAMSSEEAEKETKAILDRLNIAIDVFQEVAASELKK